jgi:hypothetical protein
MLATWSYTPEMLLQNIAWKVCIPLNLHFTKYIQFGPKVWFTKMEYMPIEVVVLEKLDSPAVSELGVRSRKLSNVRRGQSWDGWPSLLPRAPPCFGKHFKPLVQVAFAVVSTHFSFKEGWHQAGGRLLKIIAESLSQHDEKHVLLALLSRIKVEERREE